MATARAPTFIRFKEVSSPSSDSSPDSSPGATYVPPWDWEWQRKYPDREVESRVNAETYRRRFVPARNHGFLQNQEVSSPRSDSSSDSSPCATYVPPSDCGWQSSYSGVEVESHVNADTYTPSLDLEWLRIYSDTENEVYANVAEGKCDCSDTENEVYVEGKWDCSDTENEVYANVAEEKWDCSDTENEVYAEGKWDCSDTENEVYANVAEEKWDCSDTENEVYAEGKWDCSDTENEVYANVAEGKWIKHYNSNHRILLVGEGDFSFSASLAVAFGSAPNIIATSLDSEYFLVTNYEHAMSNIEKLRSMDCLVMHNIDATEVATHRRLGGMTFDRIIFNFPFAGFFKHLSREAQLRKHRTLVSLFLENAKEMIGENGEIHISHKSNGFHKEWNLESLASSHGLVLIEAVEFNQSDYEGYNTKYGFGGDNNFNCDPSKTYKFGIWY